MAGPWFPKPKPAVLPKRWKGSHEHVGDGYHMSQPQLAALQLLEPAWLVVRLGAIRAKVLNSLVSRGYIERFRCDLRWKEPKEMGNKGRGATMLRLTEKGMAARDHVERQHAQDTRRRLGL